MASTEARAISTYRVDDELGRGGMAVVYAGWHEQLDRPVALKVLASHLADDPEFRTRFLREARIAAGLHHPNLVRTYDVSQVEGRPSIVMELLAGGTLEDGSLTREEAAQVASGLAHAHERGVVHRDLKPANLLRAGNGEVKIADFGIARAVEETMVTQIGTVLGTLRYLAPEQAEGRVVGPAADVYSLGVVLDELLVEPTREDRALIERMRSAEPQRRPTAAEVAAQLDGTAVLQPKASYRAPVRLGRIAVLACGAALAVSVAVAFAFTGSADHAPRVDPVPHATTPAQQARNLEAWLRRYSR
ncbi:MAG: serine/threonine-protein kinase [Gaiellaceae bacterium]